MRRAICGLLLILMSMSILAEGNAEIEKEVSGVNRSTTTEGRVILEGETKDPTLEKVDLNLVDNKNQQLETKSIEYKQTEPTDDVLAEVSKKQTKPKYWIWGLGILAVVLAGVAASK